MNCCNPEWALKEGEQLGKRQKRGEEQMDGQDVKGRQEKLKKAFVVLPYIVHTPSGSQRGCKGHMRIIMSSYFAKPCTISEMCLYAQRTLNPEENCCVIYE